MENCLFCKIIKGEIPSTKVYEDEMVYAFNDIEPQAPHHIIIIPKLAKELGFDENGYRVINNCGKDGGQTVHHIHFHLTAGREFLWPAG